MALVLYNTLTQKKEAFKPLGSPVRMYNCGPTVYNYAHIGNFRAYMCSDIMRRYLEYKGYKVLQVMNITDVDDKTIRDSQKAKESLQQFCERYTKAFMEDIEKLSIQKAHQFPKATQHIKEMITIIQALETKGFTYKSSDGSVYYTISKFKNYGKLAHIKVDELRAGNRVKNDEYSKDDAHDFALWKAYDKTDGDVYWESPWGKGRPGWHIECSAMSMKYLGEHFDIHTGGVDLIFPHHTNEIAQSEASTGKKFVNFWLHNDYILVDGKKMSKSLGNFYTLRDLLKKQYSSRAIRFLLLGTHYRAQLNFTLKGVEGAQAAVQRIQECYRNLFAYTGNGDVEVVDFVSEQVEHFEDAMDDDFNIALALEAVFELVRQSNVWIAKRALCANGARLLREALEKLDAVLGILESPTQELEPHLQKLIEEREKARKTKDFATADKLRKLLLSHNIQIDDTPDGVRWKKVA